jgi:hypothetical protein
MKNLWKMGESCALRGIVNNQVWLAQSVIVVKDAPLDLDIVIDPQYRWEWKDVDEYQAGIQEGGILNE